MARLPRNPVLLDEGLTAAVDRVRGDLNRSEFVRNVLRRSLAARGESVAPFQTVVGKYSREEKGLIKDRTLAKKQRRNRRRAWGRKHTAKWRAKKQAERAQTIEATVNPDFIVHPDGSIVASLPSGDVAVGYVGLGGNLLLEVSRWPRQQIVDAILRAVEQDANGRLRGERFERFRAMVVDG